MQDRSCGDERRSGELVQGLYAYAGIVGNYTGVLPVYVLA